MLHHKPKPNLFTTQQVELFEIHGNDPADLSAGSQQSVNPPKRKGEYLRQLFTLNEHKFVEAPRNEPMDRFYEFGILPKSKYSFDVFLEIASLIKHEDRERSPDEIVRILHDKYPTMEKAKISRVFVKKVLSISSAALLPMLPQFANLPQQWTLMIDSTIRMGGESVLVVILAVAEDYTFPLLASFLPSENTTDLVRLLTELKQRLPYQPQAMISDFSKGFLTSLAQVFPLSIQLGCHFHALEIFARMMLNPNMKQLRKLILPLLKKLKNWAEGVLHVTPAENFDLRSFARSIGYLQEKGEFGQNLLDVSLKLLAIHDGIKDSHKLIGAHPHKTRKTFKLKKIIDKVMKSSGSSIRIAISQLRTAIERFQMIRDALSPETLWSEPSQLMQLSKKWKKDKDMVKIAEKIEELAPYLLPAIKDDRLPRTTSILESLHGSVKQTMRKWSGTSTPSSSFNWIAPLLSVLDGLDDMQWEGIYKLLPSTSWYEEVGKWSKIEKIRKLEVRNGKRLVNLEPAGLRRQVRVLLTKTIIAEVMI